MPEVEIGGVSDFFARPVVAGIELTGTVKVGDRIHIIGHTTDLNQCRLTMSMLSRQKPEMRLESRSATGLEEATRSTRLQTEKTVP